MKNPATIGRGAKIALVSLGCPKNLVDLQVVASALRRGFACPQQQRQCEGHPQQRVEGGMCTHDPAPGNN